MCTQERIAALCATELVRKPAGQMSIDTCGVDACVVRANPIRAPEEAALIITIIMLRHATHTTVSPVKQLLGWWRGQRERAESPFNEHDSCLVRVRYPREPFKESRAASDRQSSYLGQGTDRQTKYGANGRSMVEVEHTKPPRPQTARSTHIELSRPSFLCFTDPIPFLAGRNRRRPGGSKQPAVCLLGLRASVPVIVVVDLHPICGDADAVFGQKSCVFATELNWRRSKLHRHDLLGQGQSARPPPP